jgi:hypothetical protein
MIAFRSVNGVKVNPSTSQPKDWGMLRVDPERRYFTVPSKAGPEPCWYRTGLGAAEWVNI